MKYCSNCSKEIDEQSSFCPNCGAPCSDIVDITLEGAEQTPVLNKNSHRKKVLIAACAAAVIVVVVVLLLPFVQTKIESLSLLETTLNMSVGDKATVEYVIEPENVHDVELVWSSSDESVATVNELGEITAMNSGNCIITLTADDVSASLNVDVERFPGISNETYNFAMNLLETYSDDAYLHDLYAELADAIDSNIIGDVSDSSMDDISNAVSSCPMVLAAIADLDSISDGESDNSNILEDSCKTYWAFRYERALGEAMGEGSSGTFLYKLMCKMNDMSDLAEDISGFTDFMYRTITSMTDIDDLGNMPGFIGLTTCYFFD